MATQLRSSMVRVSWLQLLGPQDSLLRVHLYLFLVRYHFSSCVLGTLPSPARGGSFDSSSKLSSLLWDQDSRGDLPSVGVLCDAMNEQPLRTCGAHVQLAAALLACLNRCSIKMQVAQ